MVCVAPEHQIPGLEAVHGDRYPGRVVLVVGDPGEPDAGAVAPRGQRQPRAVVAHGAVPALDVGLAQLLEGEQHGGVARGDR